MSKSEKSVDSPHTSSIRTSTPDLGTVRRILKPRHVQLIGIGGSIGTALFVQIGYVLPTGGPGNLLIAFIFWCTVVFAVNNCLAEMATYMPITSPLVRYGERFVDEAWGLCAGVNFFLYLAFLIPFEITAFSLVIQFWSDAVPVGAWIAIVLILYAALNLFAVKFYGETEFWLSLGKVMLIVGLLLFTFITMVGGNPQRDAFGFRNWNPDKVPGTPFVEYFYDGSRGRFMGFLSCLIQAAFTVCGPEYLAMTAGEAQRPRDSLPRTFKSIGGRLITFFILGSMSVGILVPHNDPTLANALSDPQPGAGSSVYVIAMTNMGIPVLPHIVNALILLSVFSAGNGYVYCASRILYGLALEGRLPKVMKKVTKRGGVPIYCVAVTLLVACLAFLQVSSGSAKVLVWFVSLTTASQLLNYVFVLVAYLKFYYGLKAQGVDRETLPYRGYFQPYCAIYALVFTFTLAWLVGYTVFLPGNWDTATFFFSYAIILFLPVLFVVWKVIRRTKFVKFSEIDFFNSERKEVDDDEAIEEEKISMRPLTSKEKLGEFWRYVLG